MKRLVLVLILALVAFALLSPAAAFAADQVLEQQSGVFYAAGAGGGVGESWDPEYRRVEVHYYGPSLINVGYWTAGGGWYEGWAAVRDNFTPMGGRLDVDVPMEDPWTDEAWGTASVRLTWTASPGRPESMTVGHYVDRTEPYFVVDNSVSFDRDVSVGGYVDFTDGWHWSAAGSYGSFRMGVRAFLVRGPVE